MNVGCCVCLNFKETQIRLVSFRLPKNMTNLLDTDSVVSLKHSNPILQLNYIFNNRVMTVVKKKIGNYIFESVLVSN